MKNIHDDIIQIIGKFNPVFIILWSLTNKQNYFEKSKLAYRIRLILEFQHLAKETLLGKGKSDNQIDSLNPSDPFNPSNDQLFQALLKRLQSYNISYAIFQENLYTFLHWYTSNGLN